MKTETTSMGLNRTGIGTSPVDSAELIKAANEGCPDAPAGNVSGLASVRESYESEAEPVGTVPIPTTVKGAFKAVVDLVKGRGTAVFLDKLGERLAFERTGTRLYEALLTKLDASPGWPGGPTRAELTRFHDEELAHFTMLRDSLTELGADPTAQTPAADVIGVASMGLMQVMTDPRTTLPQSLNALLTAELTDNDGWRMLIDLARTMGQEELAARFQLAEEAEKVHLGSVRTWLAAEAVTEAKPEAAPEQKAA